MPVLKPHDQAVLRGVAEAIRTHVRRAFDASVAAIQRVESRVEAVEKRLEADARKSLADAYRGVWRAEGRYERGDLITHSGGLWLVMRATSDRPGTTEAVRLIVKSPSGRPE
jgi:hypothetical protein